MISLSLRTQFSRLYPSQMPHALTVSFSPPYGPNIPIYNPAQMPQAPNVGFPPYGPNNPNYSYMQMQQAPNVGFPPYGPNNPNYSYMQLPHAPNVGFPPPYGPNIPNSSPTQIAQVQNPYNPLLGGYPIFYQPQPRSSNVSQRTGQQE